LEREIKFDQHYCIFEPWDLLEKSYVEEIPTITKWFLDLRLCLNVYNLPKDFRPEKIFVEYLNIE
jgi:hypothetical protein